MRLYAHKECDTAIIEGRNKDACDGCRRGITKPAAPAYAPSNPILYIAGPMSGYPDMNYPAFFTAEDQLRAEGFSRILNPARTLVPHNTGTYSDFMRSGLRMVLDSHAIVLLDGWEQSPGAAWELDTAKRLGMSFGTLEAWLARAVAA